MSGQVVPIHGSSGKDRHDHDGAMRGEGRPEIPEKKPASTRCRRCIVSRERKSQSTALLAAAAPAPLVLTPDEAKMLAVFRAMDDRAKSDVTKLATRLARLNPYRAAPMLRLVAGGAS